MTGTVERAVTTVSERTNVDARVVGALVGALTMLRAVASGTHRHMWAEDGSVFLANAVDSPASALLATHQGYLHLAPSSVAVLSSWLPLSIVPMAYAATCAAVTGWLAWFSYTTLEGWVTSDLRRAGIVSAFALIPVAGAESTGSIANLQWFLLPAAALAILGAPRRAGSALCAVTAASSPIAVALLPFAIVRRKANVGALVGLSIGLAAQGVAVVLSTGDRTIAPRSGGAMDGVQALVGVNLNALVAVEPPVSLTPLAVALLVGLAVGLRRGVPAPSWWLVGMGSAVWTVAYASSGLQFRYAIPASILIAVAIVVAVDRMPVADWLVAALVVAWVLCLPLSDRRTSGPTWTDSIDAAECIDGVAQVVVSPIAWGSAALPCDELG